MAADTITITVELSGGLEYLFSKQKVHTIALPTSSTIQTLLFSMRDHLLTERVELFIQDSTVRPGILVLVNDVDWELEDGIDTVINDKDKITFISTLHGG